MKGTHHSQEILMATTFREHAAAHPRKLLSRGNQLFLGVWSGTSLYHGHWNTGVGELPSESWIQQRPAPSLLRGLGPLESRLFQRIKGILAEASGNQDVASSCGQGEGHTAGHLGKAQGPDQSSPFPEAGVQPPSMMSNHRGGESLAGGRLSLRRAEKSRKEGGQEPGRASIQTKFTPGL